MKGFLKLANGDVFTGQWYGKARECTGELIYFTGMARFTEFITDPSNQGKIVISTFPGILNSRLDPALFESNSVQISGLVCQQDTEMPLNRSSQNLLDVFISQDVPVLTSADTRALMKRMKREGEMAAGLTPGQAAHHSIEIQKQKVPSYEIEYVIEKGKKHIVILNFGCKKSLIEAAAASGCKVTVVPGSTDIQNVLSLKPDGIIFSGGPGNPMDWKKSFKYYRQLAMAFPAIGLGLGHQILALSFGASVHKMAAGHRNFKEAVLETDSNKVFMTSQNHEYVVEEKSLKDTGFKVSYKNVHDRTVEGLVHDEYPLTTYQFHSEHVFNPLNERIFNQFFQTVFESKGARLYA
ncbi:carbamoyl phosphate synthase small subunit [Siminovitchia sediminis]|uniref:carbamoyl-phosphate synthase (glutamine-hydrolyzing) n=1 Tax=Siminovitchia sediminis TaxID=1274353 RepID=A0ABW4KKC9_9BACI